MKILFGNIYGDGETSKGEAIEGIYKLVSSKPQQF